MNSLLSRWQILSAAPHRLLFFWGVLQLVAVLFWWSIELAGRFTPLWNPLPTTIPAIWAHGYLMIYGLFPFFIFGFLMTTYPRWMNQPEVPRSHYVPAALLLAGGSILFYPALFMGVTALSIAVAMQFCGFSVGGFALLSVHRKARHRDRFYETQLNIALALGGFGLFAFLNGLLIGDFFWFRLSLLVGAWWFLIPVLVIVAHRMIPFFSASVINNYHAFQPRWMLSILWAGVLTRGLLEFSGFRDGLFLADALLLFIGISLTLRWGLIASLPHRLLAVLHIAFAWFSIGMALYLIQDLWFLFAREELLGRGPFHALAIGFISSMALGMVTRVSRGHSGRPLLMDRMEWIVFFGLQFVALLRVFGEVSFFSSFTLLSAILWVLFTLPWMIRYAPIYLRPRVDGRSG